MTSARMIPMEGKLLIITWRATMRISTHGPKRIKLNRQGVKLNIKTHGNLRKCYVLAGFWEN